ncbi:hypothetical protein FQN53_003942 [Emmonsiellopsis sp. PD_33]|nr:hypothetical protein FQN53_003942 [Emmonsiellopsis sp. PD_33]KAK2798585.1 hypothetical protein FQN51_007605 [Onygenales sp. PD_10]
MANEVPNVSQSSFPKELARLVFVNNSIEVPHRGFHITISENVSGVHVGVEDWVPIGVELSNGTFRTPVYSGVAVG